MRIATDLERYLLTLMNDFRASNGLRALTLEQNLNQSATTHSQWLLDNRVFTHTGPVSQTSPNGSNGFDRMIEAGWDEGTSWTWGENIGAEPIRNAGAYFDEVDTIFAGWLNSSGHRANMLNANVDMVGLGIVYGILPPQSGSNVAGIMATQNFGASNGLHDFDILGQAGADTLTGADGDDNIRGAAGDDLITTHAGADYVAGGEGNDSVTSGTGDDTLMGDAGDDQMTGGTGRDSLSGGDGDDWLEGDAATDLPRGANDSDTLIGSAQADDLFAGAGDDLLEGGAGDDRLFGGAGNDVIYGQEGDDSSFGAGGDDTLIDAEGDDLLFGGLDADRFVFADRIGGFGHDTIGDFDATSTLERIDLSAVSAITNVSDLLNNHTQQIGADVLITASANSTILLQGVTLAQLDSTDFVF